MSNIGMDERRKGKEGAATEGVEARGKDKDFEDSLMRAYKIFAAWRSEIRVSNDKFRDE
jgi:hypothetical protein